MDIVNFIKDVTYEPRKEISDYLDYGDEVQIRSADAFNQAAQFTGGSAAAIGSAVFTQGLSEDGALAQTGIGIVGVMAGAGTMLSTGAAYATGGVMEKAADIIRP